MTTKPKATRGRTPAKDTQARVASRSFFWFARTYYMSIQSWRCPLVKRVVFSMMFFLLAGCLGMAQNAPQKKSQPVQPPSASDLVDGMAQRLSHDLNVKTVIGEPIKADSVTLIPILMIDVKFGSAVTTAPSGATTSQSAVPPASLFYMSGEARPLGFVAITRKGTRFINLVKSDAK